MFRYSAGDNHDAVIHERVISRCALGIFCAVVSSDDDEALVVERDAPSDLRGVFAGLDL